MNCVAITIEAHPQFYFFDECSVRFHDSQKGLFEKILPDDDNGFYDWLRDAEGALLGVRWFPHDNKSLLANNAKSLRNFDAIEIDDDNLEMKIFFSSSRAVDESKSRDQDFLKNNIYYSNRGKYAISFSAASLSSDEKSNLC